MNIGDRFDRWKILSLDFEVRGKGRVRYYPCRCECGTIRMVPLTRLRSGQSRSCGCLHREMLRRPDGPSHHPLWTTWTHMLDRCRNPRNERYARYGGRGITVCRRWESFDAFVTDMGPRPAGHTLDRINNDGDYEPSNCRWATRSQQQRNRGLKRSDAGGPTLRLEFEGKSLSLIEWSELYGLPRGVLARRLARGWPADLALQEPVKRHRLIYRLRAKDARL